jgi:hypothetical protein
MEKWGLPCEWMARQNAVNTGTAKYLHPNLVPEDDWLHCVQAPCPNTDEGITVIDPSERAEPFVGGRLQICVRII